MPNHKTDRLLELIRTLSKSEKRNFKLLASKTGGADKLYVQLFDLLEKNGEYDESKILEKISNIKKSQLSNLKANLYKQLLRSLRDLNKNAYQEIKAREHFDFAKVLYSKGQYKAAIDMLTKVKKIASRIQKKPLEYLALNFEKQIESQHVTGSMSPKAEQLSTESKSIIDALIITDQLSNLSLKLYGIYLQRGYVKSQEDILFLNQFFKANLPKVEISELDFYQKLYLYQSYVWYYHMKQEFAMYYRYAQRWVDLFMEYPEMKVPATSIYIKGIHNVLNALFMSFKFDRFDENMNKFLLFNENAEFNLSRTEKSQLELFKFTHGINRIFLKVDYKNGIKYIQKLERILDEENHPWDLHRRLVFHYKIACVYFGADDLNNTVKHLNQITNHYYPNFKEDIQCFAHILNLIAHFDMHNELLVSYKVKSVYRFLLKMKELQQVQKEIFKFIRKTPRISKQDIIKEFKILRDKLVPLENQLLERRPFLYLDIISWLDSKINEISMVEAIKKRREVKAFH